MKKFQNNVLYSREEIVNSLRNTSGGPGQSSYFSVKDYKKPDGKIYANVAFMYKNSRYLNVVRSFNQIYWDDSIGKIMKTGDEFLSLNVPTYFFIESFKKARFLYVGEVKRFTKMKTGDRNRNIPNNFLITFEEPISNASLNMFQKSQYFFSESDNIKENNVASFLNVTNDNKKIIDYKKAIEIGKKGEEIFYESIKNKKNMYKDVVEFIKTRKINEFLWLNKTSESYQPYDFIIHDEFFDVKTTITNDNDNFYVSAAEYTLIQEKKLNIVQIWLDENLKYVKHNLIHSHDVLSKYFFESKQYKAKKI